MYLRSIEIENYRAIKHARLTLDATTILIGENDSGRTSILEALMLLLGAGADRFETRLKPVHFHRQQDGKIDPLRIRLRLSEGKSRQWKPPDEIAHAIPPLGDGRRAFHFQFDAAIDSLGSITSSWTVVGPSASVLKDDPVLLEWVRKLVPVLWMRTGLFANQNPPDHSPGLSPEFESLERHLRNLVTGEAPDLFAELEHGARLAARLIERNGGVFAGAVPAIGAMAADILQSRLAASARGARGDSAAQKIGMLLIVGAVLQLARRSVVPEARPVLILENPESNLHPMTLAAVWSLLERITWQKVIGTNSGGFLTSAPLSTIRRPTRKGGRITEWSIPPKLLSREDLRRVAYHVRSRRASAMFARCWVLVEGETEFWVLPELARIDGYDFAQEGVVCVEFAQCGLPPLIRLANRLGISWHLLADGDDAGTQYVQTAERFASRDQESCRRTDVTQLQERDIETCFWHNGFDQVIRNLAFPAGSPHSAAPRRIIQKAIERTSKPFLALRLIETAARKGPSSIPPVLKTVIESAVSLARNPPG